MICAHHCDGARPRWGIERGPISRVMLILAELKPQHPLGTDAMV